MKCLLCITELPVDSNTSHITCPLCGSEYNINEGQLEETYNESEMPKDVSDI